MAFCTDITDTITILGACSGTGMLELAAGEALRQLGYRAQTLVHIEREAAAAAALVGIEAATGCESLVWDDLATFDGYPWRGLIDIAVAGLPCPAFSAAGKQGGNDDARAFGEDFDEGDTGTWGPQPHFLRVVDEMQPALVFLENVSPWVRLGHFRRFGECLCRMGYQILDPVFLAAEDVGATHKRERVFVMAYRDQAGRDPSALFGPEKRLPAGCCSTVPRAMGDDQDTDGRRELPTGTTECGRCGSAGTGTELGDDSSNDEWRDSQRTHGKGEPVGGSGMLGLFAPGRNDYGAWATVAGLDASRMPAIESGVHVLADGNAKPEEPIFRNGELLRMSGNAVVPLQAAVAFIELFQRIGSLI